MMSITELSDRYHGVLDHIATAARQAGRDPATVKLVVVTKTHPVSTIEMLYEIGARDFGENRVEAGNEKIMALADKNDINWHMIGHIQSRKAQAVAQHFNFIHSIDSLKLAQRVSRFAQEQTVPLPVVLQCNVSGEATKSGWLAQDTNQWAAVLPEFEEIAALPGIDVQGLMTMAPYSANPETARPHFAQLRGLQKYLSKNAPDIDWQHLSMGMSGDYQVAVSEGATLIRVGSAIVGSRY